MRRKAHVIEEEPGRPLAAKLLTRDEAGLPGVTGDTGTSCSAGRTSELYRVDRIVGAVARCDDRCRANPASGSAAGGSRGLASFKTTGAPHLRCAIAANSPNALLIVPA